MKKILKTSVHYSITGTKKILSSHPKFKQKVKNALMPHIHLGNQDPYKAWVNQNFPDFINIAKLRKLVDNLKEKPLISIIVPTYNTNPVFLRDCLDSVMAQVYENWELIIVDDASPDAKTRDIITSYAKHDKRIRYKFLMTNQHIAKATNVGINIAKGEFIGLLDHDDLLWPNALYEVVKAINDKHDVDFIYTDEDKIGEDRFDHFGPLFKPDWNPDFLHSVNYITHFSVIRTSLLKKIGGEKEDYNGAQDWDLIMRVTNETKMIHHIPKILYSWRVHDDSTAKSIDAKPYVVNAQKRVLEDDLRRKGYSGATVIRDKKHKGYWRIDYGLKNKPKVSIIIPSKNQYKVIKRCINSIFQKSTYSNFEIIIVDTGSNINKVLSWYKKIQANHSNLTVIEWPEQPFSYARSCNEGAKHATGEIIIMLNNDTEVITPDWIEVLASEAQRPEIGAVGCLLFYPGIHHIQHAGVGIGLGGVAANSFSMMTLHDSMSQTQHLMIHTRHNITAVTAACLAIKKDVFELIGGFDEKFRVTYNDVDLCLRLREKGYENLYTPYARLVHHESISLGLPEELSKRDTKEFRNAKAMFVRRWKKYINHDPNLNPNLSKDNAKYEISME